MGSIPWGGGGVAGPRAYIAVKHTRMVWVGWWSCSASDQACMAVARVFHDILAEEFHHLTPLKGVSWVEELDDGKFAFNVVRKVINLQYIYNYITIYLYTHNINILYYNILSYPIICYQFPNFCASWSILMESKSDHWIHWIPSNRSPRNRFHVIWSAAHHQRSNHLPQSCHLNNIWPVGLSQKKGYLLEPSPQAYHHSSQ